MFDMENEVDNVFIEIQEVKDFLKDIMSKGLKKLNSESRESR
jgi:hypothetical protein